MQIYFVSLGCDKNLVDSEKMLALLNRAGYELTDDPQQADAIVVNTCAFIHDAKQESIETLLELAEYKKSGRCRALVAAGCLAERYRDEIRREMPEVDGIMGTAAYDSVPEVLEQALRGGHPVEMRELSYLPAGLTDRVSSGLSLSSAMRAVSSSSFCCMTKLRHSRKTSSTLLIPEIKFSIRAFLLLSSGLASTAFRMVIKISLSSLCES